MPTTSILARSLSATLAVLVGVGLLVVVSQQMNPVRLAVVPPVIELEPVTITAHVPAAAPLAAAERRTATN